MTNINQIQNAQQQAVPDNSPKKAAPADKSFKQAFDRAIDNMEPSAMKTSQSGTLAELPPGNIRPGDGTSQFSEKADKALQTLNRYSEKLNDSAVSLKRLEPVLQELKEDAGQLLKEAENSGHGDSELKRIAKEFAVTANTEYVKFHRGDYL
ncbi:MAG: hypothetical protein R6V41_13100 [Desulfobacteraceae bacterium]